MTSKDVAASVIWALYGSMLYSALAAQGAVREEGRFDTPFLIGNGHCTPVLAVCAAWLQHGNVLS